MVFSHSDINSSLKAFMDIFLFCLETAIPYMFYVELFVEYYLRGFRKYLICVQNILQTDESTIICMIFELNKNAIQYSKIQGQFLIHIKN